MNYKSPIQINCESMHRLLILINLVLITATASAQIRAKSDTSAVIKGHDSTLDSLIRINRNLTDSIQKINTLLAQSLSPNKRAMLTSLIGEHKLSYISGFGGASAILDCHKENGAWVASTSVLTSHHREAIQMPLSKADLRNLNNCKISVFSNLSVSFIYGGKEYISVPYKANELNLELIDTNNFGSLKTRDFILDTSTIFENNQLMIYATDDIKNKVPKFGNDDHEFDIFEFLIIGYNFKDKRLFVTAGRTDSLDTKNFFFE